MQPPAQPEQYGGSSQAQHAPPPDAFRSIPGLQPSAVPGINLSSYGQNSQQPPFPPCKSIFQTALAEPKLFTDGDVAAWPPQLPPDPSAWLPFFQQNGMVPPPPLPGYGVPPPMFPSQSPHNRAPHAPPIAFPPRFPSQLPPQMPSQVPSQPHLQPPVAATERVQEVMESDREDGELSDGDGSSHQVAGKGKGRARPQPPRSAPRVSLNSQRIEEAYNPDRPAAGQAGPQEPVRKASQQARRQDPMDKIQDARNEAKQFIKLLNSNQITYRTLANEDLDSELLRGLYQSLNLPSEPAPIMPLNTNGVASASSAAVQSISSAIPQSQNLVPTVNTDVTPAPVAKLVPSPPGPIDRKDYIARLQAARMAKQGGTAKPSSPQNTPPAKGVLLAPAVKTPQAVTTPNPKQPVTDEQRARNTELIRQRLEAMKAKQKPVAAVSNGTTTSASGTQHSKQDRTDAEQGTQQAFSGNNTSNTQSVTASFPSIPGLFMTTGPSFNNDVPITPKPSASIPQKRSAPSDTEVSTPLGSVTRYARPVGQSPQSYQEESMMIDGSDDESNGSDMDIDDDQAGPNTSAVSPPSAVDQRQAPETLPTLPSRSGSAIPVSTVVSTPGPQTPSTLARERELEENEKRLAAMRLTLKKKFAEKREKEKAAAAAAAVAANSSGVEEHSTPGLPTKTAEPVHPGSTQRVDAAGTTVPASVEPSRPTKRLRREEIQSRLPSLDAEIASNANRMAELTREMEQLMAVNAQIAKDKEMLTQELESLGIDTDGMSHAELRAKKDEIEKETLPVPENTSHDTALASRSSFNEFPDASVESQHTEALNTATGEGRTESTSKQAQSPAHGGFRNLPGLGQAASQLSGSGTAPTHTQIADNRTFAPHEAQVPATQDRVHNKQFVRTSNEEPVTEATDISSIHGSATPLDDGEDFYSPAPLAEMNPDSAEPVGEPAQAQLHLSEALSGAARSPSEEGEVEMSESEGEEEYEPEELPMTDTPIQETQAPRPESAHSIAPSQISTEEEEDYEPPDVEQETSDIHDEAAIAEPVSGVLQVEAEDGAMDIATSSDESSDDSDSDEETTPEPEAANNTVSAHNVAQHDTNISDDLALELQPEAAVPLSTFEPVDAIEDEDEDESPRFTPYESPLRMFKSYRYHPSYAQDVAGGFLSLTFSHQIDPAKPLCQYESAGGSCNDPECSDQHFRDIGITGEKLLVQLGTANPGKSPEEKQKWNDGLRGVLKELRQKNIKDPNGIAVEIAKYRRQFLNDDTRVVNL
ncbi:hypothetical protein N0V83_001241 [Neocucurbitaria cava]|uniref:Putative zinc-finger domain-containing protein n=1 Tax=Neocucurbitaria cava TaxID=798079 RepID=A0A9W8YHH7_9PLEO|nr:hypothetical protein N0V83_001241 [Neocucurbitaria cava]